MTDLPHPDNPGQTHFEGCWRHPGHHNCAVTLIDRLQAELALWHTNGSAKDDGDIAHAFLGYIEITERQIRALEGDVDRWQRVAETFAIGRLEARVELAQVLESKNG